MMNGDSPRSPDSSFQEQLADKLNKVRKNSSKHKSASTIETSKPGMD